MHIWILIQTDFQVCLKAKEFKSCIITGNYHGIECVCTHWGFPSSQFEYNFKRWSIFIPLRKSTRTIQSLMSVTTYRPHALQNFLFLLNKANLYSLKLYLKLGLKSNTIVPASCYKPVKSELIHLYRILIQMVLHDNWIVNTQSFIDITDHQKVIWIQHRKYWKMGCSPPPSPSNSMIKNGTDSSNMSLTKEKGTCVVLWNSQNSQRGKQFQRTAQ